MVLHKKYMISYLGALLCGAFVGTISFLVIMLPLSSKFLVSIAFGALASLTLYVIVNESSFSIKLRFPGGQLLAILAIIALIGNIILSLGPQVGIISIWRSWDEISWVSWLCAIFSLLVNYFLPGYLLLRMLFPRQNPLETLLSSFIVSLLVTFLISYIMFLCRVDLVNSPRVLTIFNFILTVAYALKCRTEGRRSVPNSFSIRKEHVLVAGTAMGAFLFTLLTQLSFTAFIRGDAWRVLTYAIMTARASNPTINLIDCSYLMIYPYLLPMSMVPFFESLSIPAANFFIILISLTSAFLPMAFYLFALEILMDSRIAAVSTAFFTLFSGFGWHYYLLEKLQKGIVMQSLEGISGNLDEINSLLQVNVNTSAKAMYDFIYPLNRLFEPGRMWLWSTIVIIVFLYFLVKVRGSSRMNNSLLALSYAVSFLIHPEEALFSTGTIVPLYFLISNAELAILRKKLFGLGMGFLLIYGVDLLSPTRTYLGANLSIQFALGSCLFLIGLIYLTRMLHFRNLLVKIFRFYISQIPMRKAIAITALSLYVGILFWFILINQSTWYNDITSLIYFGNYAWYMIPIGLGVYGLLLLIFLSCHYYELPNSSVRTNIILLIISFASTIVLGRGISYLNMHVVTTGTYEWRVYNFLFGLTLSPVAAFTICVLKDHMFRDYLIQIRLHTSHFKMIVKQRLVKTGFLLFVTILFISGSLSTLFAIESWSMRQDPWGGSTQTLDVHDLSAVNYILSDPLIESNYRISSETELSTQIIGLSGLRFTDCGETTKTLYPSIFSLHNLDSVFLLSSEVRYLYVSPRDLKSLATQEQQIFRILSDFLSPIYNDSSRVVYQLPLFSPPRNSSTIVLSSYSHDISTVFPLLTISLAGKSYDIASIYDPFALSNKRLVLIPEDILGLKTYIRLLPYNDSISSLTPVNLNILANDPLTIETDVIQVNDLIVSLNNPIITDDFRYILLQWKSNGGSVCLFPRSIQIYPILNENYLHTNLGISNGEWKTVILDLYRLYDYVAKSNFDMRGDSIDEILLRLDPGKVYSFRKLDLGVPLNTSLAYILKENKTAVIFGSGKDSMLSKKEYISIKERVLIDGTVGQIGTMAFSSEFNVPLLSVSKVKNFHIIQNYTLKGGVQTPFILNFELPYGVVYYINLPVLNELTQANRIELLNFIKSWIVTSSFFQDVQVDMSGLHTENDRFSYLPLIGSGTLIFEGNVLIQAESLNLQSLEVDAENFSDIERSLVQSLKSSQLVFSQVLINSTRAQIVFSDINDSYTPILLHNASISVMSTNGSKVSLDFPIVKLLLKRPIIRCLGVTTFPFSTSKILGRVSFARVSGEVVIGLYLVDNNNFWADRFLLNGNISSVPLYYFGAYLYSAKGQFNTFVSNMLLFIGFAFVTTPEIYFKVTCHYKITFFTIHRRKK